MATENKVTLSMVWQHAIASPVTWLTITIAAFVLSQAIAKASRNHPLANPTLMSIVLVGSFLRATAVDYHVYFAGAHFIHFAIGPATVALAVPLYRNRLLIRTALIPIVAAVAVGAPSAILSVIVLSRLVGAPHALTLAMAPKSMTAGIAMGVAQQIGADPTLTAVLVIATGIVGAMIFAPLLNSVGIRHPAAQGFAVGLAAHGIGTARALQIGEVAGAFAGLAMALNGIASALLVPMIMRIFE